MALLGLSPRTLSEWVRALLRVPLAAKVAGANALIVLAALAAAMLVRRGAPAPDLVDTQLLLVVGLALAGSFVVNTALVLLALRPLQALESAAANVARGDFDTRVQPSLLADRDVTQVGATINLLLNGLAADRARTRQLAAEIVGAGDRERAYIARELHDSVAQTLAALVMQLGAAARDFPAPQLAARFATIKQLGADALEEVRMLAHTMHPPVLDDLGLAAALSHLARQQSHGAQLSIVVEAPDPVGAAELPPSIASVLYRIAQEALANAVRHAHATAVRVSLSTNARDATLEVADDGEGFDVAEAYARRPGMGLFTMRERVALLEGRFAITSERGAGTRVIATLPLEEAT
jgi:signal transduction histidine kinase